MVVNMFLVGTEERERREFLVSLGVTTVFIFCCGIESFVWNVAGWG